MSESKYRPGQHPASVVALEKARIQPGEIRNPAGRNGWSGRRRIDEELGNELEEVYEGRLTYGQAIARRVVRNVLMDPNLPTRDLVQVLAWLAPPSKHLEIDAQVDARRFEGPHCAPFMSSEEIEVAAQAINEEREPPQ